MSRKFTLKLRTRHYKGKRESKKKKRKPQRNIPSVEIKLSTKGKRLQKRKKKVTKHGIAFK